VSDENPISEAPPPSQPQVEGASEPPVELDPLEAAKAEVAKLHELLLRVSETPDE